MKDFHTIWGHYHGCTHKMGVVLQTCVIVCGMVFVSVIPLRILNSTCNQESARTI